MPDGGRGGSRSTVGVVVGCLLLGVVAGVVWWALAPKGRVLAQPGYLLPLDNPELQAGQDVTFATVTAVAGLLVAAWTVRRPAAVGTKDVLTAVLAGVPGAVLAWQAGRLLGPPAPSTGPTAGGGDPVPAPLDVHALGLVGLWPAVTATVLFAVLLASALLTRPDAPPPDDSTKPPEAPTTNW
ncbi:MAG TPA: hypothetical protein VFX41_01765 [Actinomycetales bacterium]|nr:hypothetical protein [Actinomycetales bacterium]